MAQESERNGDTESWSKGNGEFYLLSKSVTTNRKTEMLNTLKESAKYDTFNEDGHPVIENSKNDYRIYRSEEDIDNINERSKNLSAIHVNVQPKFPIVEVPIRSRPPPGVMMSPNDNLNGTWNNSHSRPPLRQSRETRVQTKLNISNLGYPSPQIPGRSYSSDMFRNSQRYRGHSLANTLDRTTLRGTTGMPSRDDTFARQRSTRRRHDYNCPKYKCSHNTHRSASRHRHHNCNGTVPTILPFAVAMPQGIPMYPEWQVPMTPFYYPNAPMAPPGTMMNSPVVPLHNSLPYRTGRVPPNARTPNPWMTPGTMSMRQPIYPQYGVVHAPWQNPCMCCPSGNHLEKQRNSKNFFTFDSDYGHSTLPATKRISKQYSETMRSNNQLYSRQMATPNGFNEPGYTEASLRKSQQTPNEYIIPVQEGERNCSPSGVVSTNEVQTSYMSQKYANTQSAKWSMENTQKLLGEVTREDGFPPDYIDLMDKGPDYNGDEDYDDPNYLQTPDKYVVIQLVDQALENATGPSGVAATLKKAMDEHFGPAWHVVAGVGAYGSNIASISGQLLHFKAFGWAFLLWKTAHIDVE